MPIASQDQSLPSSNSHGGTEFGQVFLQISWHGGMAGEKKFYSHFSEKLPIFFRLFNCLFKLHSTALHSLCAISKEY